MAMDEATWQSHANRLSSWSRVTILPFLCVAIWNRVWLGMWSLVPITVVLTWTWLNPRLFNPPTSDAARMTRASLGGKLLLANQEGDLLCHHKGVAKLLAITSAFACALIAVALWMLSLGLLASRLIFAMGAKLWFLDRMVWLFEDHQTSNHSCSKGALV